MSDESDNPLERGLPLSIFNRAKDLEIIDDAELSNGLLKDVFVRIAQKWNAKTFPMHLGGQYWPALHALVNGWSGGIRDGSINSVNALLSAYGGEVSDGDVKPTDFADNVLLKDTMDSLLQDLERLGTFVFAPGSSNQQRLSGSARFYQEWLGKEVRRDATGSFDGVSPHANYVASDGRNENAAAFYDAQIQMKSSSRLYTQWDERSSEVTQHVFTLPFDVLSAKGVFCYELNWSTGTAPLQTKYVTQTIDLVGSGRGWIVPPSYMSEEYMKSVITRNGIAIPTSGDSTSRYASCSFDFSSLVVFCL